MSEGMATLTDHITYADAQRLCSPARLWELFDGDRQRLNIAHECIDRHPTDRIAVRLVRSREHGGRDEAFTFGELAAASARFAHYLADRGVGPGDRVGIMLEPSLPFYAGLFGAMKRGAIAVPLFTLFGPDGLRLRIDDCAPRLLLVSPAQAAIAGDAPGLATVVADDAFLAALATYPDRYAPDTRADDLAVFQYTSGTTRERAPPRAKTRALRLLVPPRARHPARCPRVALSDRRRARRLRLGLQRLHPARATLAVFDSRSGRPLRAPWQVTPVPCRK
jgi:acetyl-CoA synthetase